MQIQYPFPVNGIDPLIEISWQQYYPGLITHETPTGIVSHLLRASPRWRGTAQWGIQKRNKDSANAIENLLMQLSGGINYTQLPLYHKQQWKPTLEGTAANSSTLTVQSASPSPGRISVPARDAMAAGVVFRTEDNPRVFTITKLSITAGIATLDYWPKLNFISNTRLIPATSIDVQASPGDSSGPLLVAHRETSGPWAWSWIERITL